MVSRTNVLAILRSIIAALAFLFANIPTYALKDDAEQPINIRARSVDVNEKTGLAVYKGDVYLVQGSLQMRAERMEVSTRASKTEKIRAFGNPVHMRTRSDKNEDLSVTTKRADYHVASKNIDLYGDVVLRRDGDVMTGAVFHYNLAEHRFTAEGDAKAQVSVTIQPAAREKTPQQ